MINYDKIILFSTFALIFVTLIAHAHTMTAGQRINLNQNVRAIIKHVNYLIEDEKDPRKIIILENVLVMLYQMLDSPSN